jgi:hypothetical protein
MRAPNSTVGTAAGAARDTQLFQQARAELGEGASVSEVARRAQELKTAPIARPVAATGVRPVSVEPSEPTAIAKPQASVGVRGVEPVGPKRPSMVDHWLGEHSSNFDPANPRHAEVLQMKNEEMAAEANRIRFEGKSDWKASDLQRSDKVHGKGNWSPVKQRLANELMKESTGEPAGEFEIRAPYSAEAPAKPRGVRSMLPTPEEEARIRKSMVSREAAKKSLESGR